MITKRENMKQLILLLCLQFSFCLNQEKDNDKDRILLLGALAISSPSSSSSASVSDSSLSAESRDSAQLTFFPNTPQSAFNSGISDKAHGSSILMKVNSTGKASINTATKSLLSGTFSEGSLVVKEIYSSGTLSLIAVMKKKNESPGGNWLWGEYSPSGTTVYSVNNNGSGCTGCHSKGKDYVRIFEY